MAMKFDLPEERIIVGRQQACGRSLPSGQDSLSGQVIGEAKHLERGPLVNPARVGFSN
jgi:hypothetical protein